ncbi:hypothetical protein [Microvirga pudoricolor]|uniref:hypothetical protein n=1 Tax=Microvirga pudoricolor TaxID=2778729 RepID=UPI00194DF26D|nr:hypothetical protein [Microvirga pudoricolor]MBM6594754.1 hypothetical protein [Microvirga pudoricolor]
MRLALLATFGFLNLAVPSMAATLDGLAVDVTNTSEPILCAEKDNVAINFASPEVRNFKIEAVHPAYIGNMRQDRWEPDWTACEDISEETSNHTQPRMQILHEDDKVRVTGLSFHSFWRPTDVTVRVGERTEKDIHMMQILVRREGEFEEVAVLYPGDGYWRIHPQAPDHLGFVAYGSSFLVGPVEFDQRPVVNIKEVVFDPKAMTFALAFKDGSSGRVAVENLNTERLRLDVTFDRPVKDRPFAALRSMYVTEFNADVARIAAREAGAKSWREESVMGFKDARATDVWLGRLLPSRHNTSAPDMMFNGFRAEPRPSR